MATWQQAGNSGALLAGLGGMNSNAPRASDADATLAYIRQNNEMERSGRNNVGLQALQGISSVMDMYKQMDQQKRQQEFQQAYADAYTSGDRDAMRKLASQYPEQFDAVRNGMKFVDEDQRSTVGTLAASARLAASSPEAMMSWLQNNSSELTRAGVDPLDVAKMYQQNPQGFTEFVDHLGMAALGPIDYFNVQDKMAGREIDRGRLAETIRSNQAGEALQARGQDISRANALTSAYAPTAAMQNYNQYAQMLKADPDGAAAFAAAAGINPNAKKLLKVETNPDGSVTKYYTDGSEEAGKLNQPISGDGIKPISLPQAQSIIDKANEGSKKAAGFALRLKDSMDSMNQLSKSIDPKRVALINRSLGDGTIANLSLSPAEQQYMVNARDALYAILRPETGAAITLPEMQEYSKMYLPQPGDSKAATETKMRKMQGQYNSLRGQSGRVYDALVVSSAANSQQQSNSQQPANTQQQQSQSGSYTSKSGIQFTVE
ncbi:phage DNA ejection protein [Escherichia coli]|uniref:phage DNA ejection protein n=2 Tax=Escherichia coli TaxID=562 RepID=UPI000E1E0E31|nr:phage DNA ejection protein [Escherichia coli]MDL5161032.1 phage DNA ejection protein [Escherichia coli]MDL5169442.1 phage DNA ejection protein [Escherichia coli]MDL5186941.1 phage DNA ejection protein [Escherichia coli]MDL5214076.1 phage DNA ejection protein [Escherichia coli]MDL5229351.1 phage DNA ejection protein [Escherichia coli]